MSEIRTTSATGGEKGVKDERHDLVPRKALGAIARVFGFGAKKYADHNWRKKYEWGKSIAALQRHIDAFVDGETYDEESGQPHLAHAGFHILVLLTWLEEDGEGVDNPMDDRWPAAMERAKKNQAISEGFKRALGVTDDGPKGGPGAAGGIVDKVFYHSSINQDAPTPSQLAREIRDEAIRGYYGAPRRPII